MTARVQAAAAWLHGSLGRGLIWGNKTRGWSTHSDTPCKYIPRNITLRIVTQYAARAAADTALTAHNTRNKTKVWAKL